MFDSIKYLMGQSPQTIPDVSAVKLPEAFRGLPLIDTAPCPGGCAECAAACPTAAIHTEPLRIDLGYCVFCGECQSACPEKKIRFTNGYQLAASSRADLLVSAGNSAAPLFSEQNAREEIARYFGGSLKLRQISAGGCNACETELNACGNINFDMGRFGIEFVASPRHADGVVITGPVSANMARALEICYQAVPSPKIVVLTGACAISGGIFSDAPGLNRAVLDRLAVDLYVPGCPPHPLTFINGILQLIRRKTGR